MLDGLLVYLVHVSDNPALGKRKLSWQVVPLEESNTGWILFDRPPVICSIVDGCVILAPAISAAVHTLRCFGPISTKVVDVPRGHVVGSISVFGGDLLVPH